MQVNALSTQATTAYREASFQNYTVNGVTAGQFKEAGTFSYVRIYGAGHEVPAYKVSAVDFVLDID